jgi:hypothetical protein
MTKSESRLQSNPAGTLPNAPEGSISSTTPLTAFGCSCSCKWCFLQCTSTISMCGALGGQRRGSIDQAAMRRRHGERQAGDSLIDWQRSAISNNCSHTPKPYLLLLQYHAHHPTRVNTCTLGYCMACPSGNTSSIWWCQTRRWEQHDK